MHRCCDGLGFLDLGEASCHKAGERLPDQFLADPVCHVHRCPGHCGPVQLLREQAGQGQGDSFHSPVEGHVRSVEIKLLLFCFTLGVHNASLSQIIVLNSSLESVQF